MRGFERIWQKWGLEMFNELVTVQRLIDKGILSIGDGYRAKNDELSDEGIPFARAGNINDGFHFSDADKFPEQNLSKVGEKVSRPGDILFTSKGTVGRYAIVDENTPNSAITRYVSPNSSCKSWSRLSTWD